MGEGTKALGVATGARCYACAALFLSLVAFAGVGAGAFYGATEVLALKTAAGKVEAHASELKSMQSHLEQSLQTLRSTSSDLGSRLLAVERALSALQSAPATGSQFKGKGKGKGRGEDAPAKAAEAEEESKSPKDEVKADGKADGEEAEEDPEEEAKGKGRGKKGKRRKRRNKGRQ